VSPAEAAKILEEAGHALRAGRITPSDFLVRTGARWRQTAAHLYSRWRRRLPAWVERDDVEQELKLLAVHYVRTWDPGRSRATTLGSYVVWCSIHRTQRKMDHWRGASLNGNSGKNPSRYELAFSRVYDAEDGDPGTRVPGESEDPIDRIDSGRQFETMMQHCRTVRQALVLMALRATEGAVDRAAHVLWGNFRARLECELRSEAHAQGVVRQVIEDVMVLFAERRDDVVLPPDSLFEPLAEEGAA
jgi:hypothetical protein